MRALLSIHDLMPETRAAVSSMLAHLFAALPALQPRHITLLVVPGRAWCSADIDWLQGLAEAGHPLAGHGWQHQAVATAQRSLSHHLHSALLSRDAAEHLSRPAHQVLADVLRCHAWFVDHDLPVSPLYVPPAWAAGAVSAGHWAASPFALLETLSGIHDTRRGEQHWLPLLGYQADNRTRVNLLRSSNRFNKWLATWSGRPLRIGLHPDDLDYGLAGQLLADLHQVTEFVDYRQYVADHARKPLPGKQSVAVSAAPQLRAR